MDILDKISRYFHSPALKKTAIIVNKTQTTQPKKNEVI
jgi:hypothetical protein